MNSNIKELLKLLILLKNWLWYFLKLDHIIIVNLIIIIILVLIIIIAIIIAMKSNIEIIIEEKIKEEENTLGVAMVNINNKYINILR